MNQQLIRSNGSGRWQLLLIGVVFTLPIIAAFLWQPTGYVNHGQLVVPARPLEDVVLERLDGSRFRLSELGRKWTLLHVSGRSCADACEQSLYKIQQVRLTQSKNAHRVQSVFVTAADGGSRDRVLGQVSRHPGMISLLAGPDELHELARQLEVDGDNPLITARIFIIDPQGNLMMSYSFDADPSGIRKDLVRLLKVSQVG